MEISKTKLADLGTMSGIGPQAAQSVLPVGKVVADRFEIVQVIGQGGMGVVYEAHDRMRDDHVALKFLIPQLLASDTARQRFLNEAKIAISLSHPNIISVYDVVKYEDTCFLTMELLKGQSLRQRLVDLAASKQHMPIAEALGIIKEVAAALEYAHHTTIHRDIKPENIWILANGKAKLMDFGIARLQSQTQGLTKTAAVLGTAYYMAPEQLVGTAQIDHRADQYSLGVMLYERLTGTLPIGRIDAVSRSRPGVSPKVDELVAKMLSGRVEERYLDDAALLKALNAVPCSESKRKSGPQGEQRIGSRILKSGSRILLALIVVLIGIPAALLGVAMIRDWYHLQVLYEADAKRREAVQMRPDQAFRDCADCPEMVIVQAGSFMMGSPAGEANRDSDEGPVHRVTLQPFALGKTEVTFAQWDACVADGGCDGYRPKDEGWGRGNRPVINVNWNNAQTYVQWLSRKTGKGYSLPSEAQWEYAARGGTTTPFHTGTCVNTSQANYDGNYEYNNCGAKTGVFRKQTMAVASFPANAYGLHDMIGNVREWTHDCYNPNYNGAPTDGSAWTAGKCAQRVLRGGSWVNSPQNSRSADRIDFTAEDRGGGFGFRAARTLP